MINSDIRQLPFSLVLLSLYVDDVSAGTDTGKTLRPRVRGIFYGFCNIFRARSASNFPPANSVLLSMNYH